MNFSKIITLQFVIIFLVSYSAYAAAKIPLTPEEALYLQKNPVINMCVDPDWLPYEKLDIKGRHIGLVANYMGLLQVRLKVRFNVVPTKSWQETQSLYEEGFCDIVSALNETHGRAEYLDFTPVYLTSPAVLVVNESNETVKTLADLDGKTIAMVKGYVYETRLHEEYPDIKIVYQKNMLAALKKVSEGKVDATLGPMFLSFTLIQDSNLDNLKILGDAEYQDELTIGIRKNNKILTEIMTKAVYSLTPEDHHNLRRSWAAQRRQYHP